MTQSRLKLSSILVLVLSFPFYGWAEQCELEQQNSDQITGSFCCLKNPDTSSCQPMDQSCSTEKIKNGKRYRCNLSIKQLINSLPKKTTSINDVIHKSGTLSSSECRDPSGLNSSLNKEKTAHSTLPTTDVLTEKEFEALVKVNQFLIKMNDNGPLTPGEKHQIELAHSDYNTHYHPKVNRPISDFLGETLVIGGGKKFGTNHHNKGITNIEKAQDVIKDIESFKFHPDTGHPLTIEDKKALIDEYEKDIRSRLDNYYTINFDATTEPDLVDSATDIKGVLSALPAHRFENIYYENVNTFVFLNKNTWRLAEELCKKNGTIKIEAGLFGMRLLPIVLKDTKWEKPVLKQLQENYAHIKKTGSFSLILRNE